MEQEVNIKKNKIKEISSTYARARADKECDSIDIELRVISTSF